MSLLRKDFVSVLSADLEREGEASYEKKRERERVIILCKWYNADYETLTGLSSCIPLS